MLGKHFHISKFSNLPSITGYGGEKMDLNKIRELCKRKCMTLRELEIAADLGTNTLYRWNGKTHPSVDKVKRVASVLGVTVDELLRGETA